jgi:hypothetical protein
MKNIPFCFLPDFAHLLGSQRGNNDFFEDLDAISTPFQIYFIQATTTRFLEPVNSQVFGVEA